MSMTRKEIAAETAEALDGRRSSYFLARERLLTWCPPGSTVYVSLRHVSRSGMYRVIAPSVVYDGRLIDITSNVLLLGVGSKPRGGRHGVAMGGCGMDMGFALVHHLSGVLYGSGFTCIGERCPSNDHFNGDKDYTPHHHRNGDYALRKEWI